MRSPLSRLVLALARAMGSTLRDAETGEALGRAMVLTWRGRVWVLGLERPVRAVFLPKNRLNYWRHELGFVAAKEPDYPRE